MAPKTPRGVIAAIATAVDQDGEPDCARSVALARHLLAHGCDGLNVLGTTGEATSFSVAQRQTVMNAYAGAELPLSRCLVGTGAAALADAVTLTSHAAELGFGGALLLPPFYYKDIVDDGLFAYVERIMAATAARPICLYLYHFPALSTVPWPLPLVGRMIEAFGPHLRGLKDSSGDMGYARAAAALAEGFSVFPSTEGALVEARAGRFAGCISAPRTSIPIYARSPIITATPRPWRRQWRSAGCSTASRSSRASRRSSGTSMPTPLGRGSRRR
ncbi:MAG: dihydrodipicolinate synthase family protein [Rhodoplanes sp.]